MSETDTTEPTSVEELINQITAGELNKAEGSFQSIVQDKMADALESQRIATAQAIFNTPEGLDDEEDEDDFDITDEEIEDIDEDEEILAELDDDEDDEELSDED